MNEQMKGQGRVSVSGEFRLLSRFGKDHTGDSAETSGKKLVASYLEASVTREGRGCLMLLLKTWPTSSSKCPQSGEE